MPRIPIVAGAYQSRSLITGAQRCINLFPEVNDDPQAPVPVTHFCTPGLTVKGTPNVPGAGRAVYTARNGDVYSVVGSQVIFWSPVFGQTVLGNLVANLSTPVKIVDNGLVAIIVDGTTRGYAIDLATHRFGQITDPNFLGGTYVDFLDGFFILNAPGTNSFYISLSFVTYDNLVNGVINPDSLYPAFDPLDIAAKIGSSDNLTAAPVMHRNIWLLGSSWSSEPWYNTGAADFVFGIVPGAFFEHGVGATYSVAKQDLAVFFLSVDRYGAATILRMNADFSIDQISTRGIEYIISQMPTFTDAVAGCYQQNGHAFYVINFPTANRTFACELKTGFWHELSWKDVVAGTDNRHRANAWTFGYGLNLCIDWQNGKLYQLDPNNLTDFGGPVQRLRTIPHVVQEGKRLRCDSILADLQGGTLGSATPDNPPQVFLRVSVDRGGSFSDPLPSQFGAAGDYAHMPFWRKLGMARDFVFELSWSDPISTAFNGLFYEGIVTNDNQQVGGG